MFSLVLILEIGNEENELFFCTFKSATLYKYIHTYTLLMLPKWAFQLNRKKKKKKIQIYKLIENVNTIISNK